MAYGDTKYKTRGIRREPIIMEGVLHGIRKLGHSCKAIKSSKNEDMRDKIDYKLDFEKETFKGYFYIPIDIKSGWTFTLLTDKGFNTLESSKSGFLVYEVEEGDDYYIFLSVPKLRDLVKAFPPRLRKSRNNNSMYFSIIDYLEAHGSKFTDDEYFELEK